MKVFGVTGWKNAGKTGLMERLVTEITGRGFSVSTLKHAHHVFDVDHPGKDSHRHRVAGATEVLVSSRVRWAQMSELRNADEPTLAEHLARMKPVDLVLIEGWKKEDHPKVEAWRAETQHPLIAPNDPLIKLVASDAQIEAPVPVLDLNDHVAIADFILRDVGLVTEPKDGDAPATLTPPPLKDDCFALPPGVDWLPVDEALTRLKNALSPIGATQVLPLHAATGRVLAKPAIARRANPPGANSAVDGYGFAHSATDGLENDAVCELSLVDGRAAAGSPYRGAVPLGHAIRILTGALLPEGVDTVVLEEDVTTDGQKVAFRTQIKPRANCRRAGEDVEANQAILNQGHRLTAGDIALLAATGTPSVEVFRPLRVAVLSTGDELAAPGTTQAPADVTYDANRPMLLSMLASMGYETIDMGMSADDPEALKGLLDDAASQADAILTSGGASAGDEDHVSAVLGAKGNLTAWRIAVKPGRPLVLATWNGVPVFGLPGNPVAAFVCATIFARPALELLGGAAWSEPVGFQVAAAFSKNKKKGRREYLRARLTADGSVETFKSEGSGRISGLAWATGLVELGDGAQSISPGDPVRFIPFSSFGL